MSDEGLIGALRTAHGAVAAAQAAEVFAVRELYRRRRAENVEPGTDGVRAGEFAASEVAVALHAEEATAGALIDIGLALDESLPRTRAAFAAGRIDVAKVRVIVDCTRGLAAEVVAVLEPRLIETAERTDPGRLRQAARRWVARVDPGGAQRRRERRQDERDVRIRGVQDGMAVFDGLMPAPGAQTVAMRLREMSYAVCSRDPRTMPQRRADALVALADGSGRLRCRCERGERCPVAAVPIDPPRRALIQVGIPAESLFGLRDAPGYLAGYGPIDAALARRIAEHARFQAISEQDADEEPSAADIGRAIAESGADARGAHLDSDCRMPAQEIATAGTRADGPSAVTRAERTARAVDGSCRFPGCAMPAAESEPETTRRGGLVSLCSRHRRLKSLADKGRTGWRVILAGRDRLRWTTPTGDIFVSVREGARYLFPHTDTEAPVVPPAFTRRTEPTRAESPAPGDRPTAEDLCYPLSGHLPVHRQLSRLAPEDDIS
ncbi:DUF222 domain-containing protein [Nocardia arizonensis]|uniref:DUF222 domain-containing protein n=1 Tax=Nocardia arizonensis TaxID=1141647 RepID=UPI000ADDDCC6|nr:DUF222 domain-containing protein [Nocardia arizonensis]